MSRMMPSGPLPRVSAGDQVTMASCARVTRARPRWACCITGISSAAPRSSCRTTCGPASRGPIATSPRSTGPTRRWPPTTAPRDPGPPGKPRDKAKVEDGVLLAERWILAALRHRTFFSLAEANAAIARAAGLAERPPLQEAPRVSRREPVRASSTARPCGRCPPSPTSIADMEDRDGQHRLPRRGRPALVFRALPAGRRSECDIRRHAPASVEVFHRGRRVASHPALSAAAALHHATPRTCPSRTAGTRSGRRRGSSRWAERTGPATAGLVAAIMASPAPSRAGLPLVPRHHAPGQALRRRAPGGRLRAGPRASAPSPTAASSRSSKDGLDGQPLPGAEPVTTPIGDHANVRGAGYYE